MSIAIIETGKSLQGTLRALCQQTLASFVVPQGNAQASCMQIRFKLRYGDWIVAAQPAGIAVMQRTLLAPPYASNRIEQSGCYDPMHIENTSRNSIDVVPSTWDTAVSRRPQGLGPRLLHGSDDSIGVGKLSRDSSMLQIEVWDEDRWRSGRVEYESLLQKSQADQLFLSWDWLTLWWESLAPRRDGDTLQMIAARSGGELVGMMPVFRNLAHRRGLRYRVCNLLGGCVRQARGVFSEYLDAVALPGREAEVRRACVQALLGIEGYSEISVATSPAFEDWEAVFRARGRWRGAYVRTIDHMTSYQADISGGFAAYLESLSANARRSIYNLRRRLQSHGQVCFELVDVPEQDAGLEELNDLHRQRWGSPAFGPMTTRLQRDLMKAWQGTGRVRMSRLTVAGRTVSMLHDLRIGAIQYNIQMGFDPAFDPSLSLGLLHLGYAMESAAGDGVTTYDFLAGRGRVADYKKRIASRSRKLASVQYFHGPLLSAAFRLHDCLRRMRGARAAPVPVPSKGPAPPRAG